VSVGSVGQYAGSLFVTNGAVLNITNGWLRVADTLNIAAGCTNSISRTGMLIVSNSLVNNGVLRLTGQATLAAYGTFTNNGTLDIMSWRGVLPSGFVNNGTVLDHSLTGLSSPAVGGSDFHVSIQGYIGHSYQLQSSDDLASGQWQSIGATAVGNNALLLLTDAGGATNPQKFYRVLIDP
jgi:hypothetical protein